ncbi:MAG: D-alanine--D-alanine ligase [Actinobacteria bacterium]|nr:D-alanine--D-alanine ligase [Actinomycetota bacterium]MBI3687360.1 D-alanine--D-alanine ligase [Actinomycetota bacterium]
MSRPAVTTELATAIIAGGLAFEREVSLRSGRRIADALRHAGYLAPVLDTDAALIDRLIEARLDAVFIALHGETGEDGSLRSVLDLLDVPYVGAGAQSCRVAWDKPNAKAAVRAAGMRTPDWVALPESTFRELGAQLVLGRIVARLGLPLMVKPAQGGSALGAQRVDSVEDLPAAMVGCFAYGGTALIEQYVDGVELAISVLDRADRPQALPAVEIEPASGVFDYAARYTAGMTTYHTPARLSPDTLTRAAHLAERAHQILGLRDLSRTDAIITPDGEAHFLEVNVSPGMTETSLFPMAVAAAGLDLGGTCVSLLRRAAERSAGAG